MPRGWVTIRVREIFVSQQQDLSNLRNLVGAENVLAECAGVNYTVYVTDSRLLVGKRFANGEKYVNVPHAEVSMLELITKSLIAVFLAAVLATWWRRRVAVLRIGISGTKEPITVRLVPASKAEGVFKALKG